MKIRLRVLRAERECSQADLAGRLGVCRQPSSIDTGKYDPSVPLAFHMAVLSQLRIAEIFLAE